LGAEGNQHRQAASPVLRRHGAGHRPRPVTLGGQSRRRRGMGGGGGVVSAFQCVGCVCVACHAIYQYYAAIDW